MEKLSFVVSLFTKDNDYQMAQAADAEQTARTLGVDLQIVFADNDSIEQSQQLLSFIQARSSANPNPDGIILEPVGGPALPQVARAAASAGIGWVLLNRDADYLHELRKAYAVPIFRDYLRPRRNRPHSRTATIGASPSWRFRLIHYGAFGKLGLRPAHCGHARNETTRCASEGHERTMDRG